MIWLVVTVVAIAVVWFVVAEGARQALHMRAEAAIGALALQLEHLQRLLGSARTPAIEAELVDVQARLDRQVHLRSAQGTPEARAELTQLLAEVPEEQA